MVGVAATYVIRVAAAWDVARLRVSRNEAPTWKKFVAGWAALFLIALAWGVAARTFYTQPFRMSSGGMTPTLLLGDWVLVNKFTYRLREPSRGDVIAFKYPRDEKRIFIQRVIATGGEEVAMKDRMVFVNGRPLVESYAAYSKTGGPGGASYEYGPVVVPPASFFVLGDNRDNSQDSRYWGFLKGDKIRGRAFLIYWSWDSDEGRLRWSRLGQTIS